MSAVTELKFEPPGPGSWSLDYTHWTRPVTRFQAEVFPEQFIRGFAEYLKRYGLLLDYLDWEFVNGFPYYCPRPVGALKDAVGHPPKHVWDELMRTDPEVSERLKTSAMYATSGGSSAICGPKGSRAALSSRSANPWLTTDASSIRRTSPRPDTTRYALLSTMTMARPLKNWRNAHATARRLASPMRPPYSDPHPEHPCLPSGCHRQRHVWSGPSVRT